MTVVAAPLVEARTKLTQKRIVTEIPKAGLPPFG